MQGCFWLATVECFEEDFYVVNITSVFSFELHSKRNVSLHLNKLASLLPKRKKNPIVSEENFQMICCSREGNLNTILLYIPFVGYDLLFFSSTNWNSFNQRRLWYVPSFKMVKAYVKIKLN